MEEGDLAVLTDAKGEICGPGGEHVNRPTRPTDRPARRAQKGGSKETGPKEIRQRRPAAQHP